MIEGITPTQAKALRAARHGPLLCQRVNYGRLGQPPVKPETARSLVDLGLFEKGTNRSGFPLVRLTDAGRETIDGSGTSMDGEAARRAGRSA